MAGENDIVIKIGTSLDSSTVEKDVKKLVEKIQKTAPKYIKRISGTNKGIATSFIDNKWYSSIVELTKAGNISKRRGSVKKSVSGSEEDILKLSRSGNQTSWEQNVRLKEINYEKQKELDISKDISTELKEQEKIRERTLNDAKSYYNQLEDEYSKIREIQSINIRQQEEDKNKFDREQMLKDAKAYFTPKEKPQSNASKLFSTLKRVGFYRIARNFFRMFESGISEGLTSLSSISPKANETLSKLSGNLTTIGNSLAVVIMPILEIAQPILQLITDTVAHLAEGFSYLAYKLGITSSWFKINTEYAKEFNKQTNKLSFDKFEALSGQDDSSSMLTEITEDDSAGTVSNIATAISSIGITLAGIGTLEIIKWIVGGGVKTLLDNTKDFTSKLGDVKSKIVDIGASLAFAYSIYEIITNVKDLINNWDAKSLADKIKSICKIALYGLGAILIALGSIPVIGTPMKIAGIIAIASTAILDGIGLFANGGMPEQGSLFIAGEAGAELVTTSSSGQTGVTNIAQFKQAMLEALYEWSDSSSGGSDVVLNLDGAEIARSKRYIGEMNRRNSGLNLR